MLSSSVRRFSTSALRRMHYEEGPGKNLPFSVNNKWKLLFGTFIFTLTGIGGPCFIIKKKEQKEI
ncbi:putative Cytochrome c oxidase subunit 7C mitochondrial protein [Naja naja]|nr:putative Cytochrome c oxidase subunit 7C mitochondrial protein [Naja naja]